MPVMNGGNVVCDSATDAAKKGENKADIQSRLVHTSGRTTDIYIKESVPARSEIDMDLPWKDR